ncbi:MAG: hypothetical protein MUQ10_07660, partial [Anaerolineae bacterium]|nr:hypothetical protein [Anaerolineae bacterium]
MIYDIGIYWDRSRSMLKQRWIAENLFAPLGGREQIALSRKQPPGSRPAADGHLQRTSSWNNQPLCPNS